MCCASLYEAVTEKNYPTLAPLCVNNPYFLYAPYFLMSGKPGYRKLSHYCYAAIERVPSIRDTTSLMLQTWFAIVASIAGVTRSV
jgi:hypothetical protein